MATSVYFTVSCPSCASEFPVDPERVPAAGVSAICSTCMRVFRVEVPSGVFSGMPALPFRAEPREVVTEQAEALGPWDLEDVEVLEDIRIQEEVEVLDDHEVFGGMEALVEAEGEREEVQVQGFLATEPPETVQEAPEPETAVEGGAEPEAMREPESERKPEPGTASSLLPDAEARIGTVEGKSLSQGMARFGRRDPRERARRLARVLVSDMITYHPARYEEALENDSLRELFEDEVEKSWKEFVDQVGDEMAQSTEYFVDALNQILARGRTLYDGPGRPR